MPVVGLAPRVGHPCPGLTRLAHVVYVVLTVGMFFNPALRGMDVRQGPAAEPADVRASAQDGETMMASRTTDIH